MHPVKEAIRAETRRQFFGTAAKGIGGLALANLLAQDTCAFGQTRDGVGGLPSLPHFAPTATRCIYLHMMGAPPQMVQLAQPVEHLPPDVRRHPVGVFQIQHRVGPAAKPHAGVLGRQKSCAPQLGRDRLHTCSRMAPLGVHHDERRQVLVHAAQAIRKPGPDAGTARYLLPGLDEGDPRLVIDGVCVHRPDDGQVVGHARRVRQQFREPRPAMAVLRELEHRGGDRKA